MRAIWKGAISFGLVHIPVRVYAATEDHDVKLRLIHAACGTPIRYVKFCDHCDRAVAAEEIVHAYEYEPGRFVPIASDEIESIPLPQGKVIRILGFVNLAEIDPVYYDRSYFLEPAEGGERPYALLRSVMMDSARVAIARSALRARESLATVRVYQEQVLMMETMYWPDEVRLWAGLRGVDLAAGFSADEKRLAMTLVDALTGPFQPGAYRDTYREALQNLVAKKLAGQEVVSPPSLPEVPLANLIEALRASVAQVQGQGAPPSP